MSFATAESVRRLFYLYWHTPRIAHPFSCYCPAAASTTELGVRIRVVVGDGESLDSALRRFKKEVNKSGHMMELRHRRYFENAQEKKKRKKKEAGLRRKFERMQRRRMQRF